MTATNELEAAGYRFRMDQVAEGMECSLSAKSGADEGITDIHIKLSAAQPVRPTETVLKWKVPMKNIHFKWNTACFRHRFLDVMNDCVNSFTSRSVNNAPVMALYDIGGTNALTFALSDAMYENGIGVSIGEEGWPDCTVRLFCEPWDAINEYSVILRIDQRRVSYQKALVDVAEWWQEVDNCKPAYIPDDARQPFYSSWYSYHGQMTQDAIEKEAVAAAELGMKGILVDAGWGGYEGINTDRFPDLSGMVQKVHDLGMKILLWTSPSIVVDSLKDKSLVVGKAGKRRMDFRYPETRAHAVNFYRDIMTKYNVDGFKIDFIGSLGKAPEDEPDNDERDCKSLPEGADRMLGEAAAAMRTINPEAMIEFRQRYNGPHMLKHATMMRAIDCGYCYADNRQRVLDIRLTAGKTPAHADMIAWSPEEPVESAAMHLIHTLFSVPQISVKLHDIAADHKAVIRTYLKFWSEHRDVILDGELTATAPQDSFPLVLAETSAKLLVAFYGDAVARISEKVPDTILLVNGTYNESVVLNCAGELGKYHLRTTTCTGKDAGEQETTLSAGAHAVPIPVSGYGLMEKA
ncbi:MAG: hypothetical protein QF473_29105 [Planctomycetota bacterium]|nr:hypothetical protein [Planctomycetota bacterium]